MDSIEESMCNYLDFADESHDDAADPIEEQHEAKVGGSAGEYSGF